MNTHYTEWRNAVMVISNEFSTFPSAMQIILPTMKNIFGGLWKWTPFVMFIFL